MQRGNLNDLTGFLAIARERSFTKAAAKLDVSQSALSHKIRELEERLGVRLLTRTTRSVAPTEAGERLLRNLTPHFEQIDAELAALNELRDKPAGNIRITAVDYVADTILLPKLAKFLRAYPDIKVEIIIDYGLTDIVAEGYDAGVRGRTDRQRYDRGSPRAGRPNGRCRRAVLFPPAIGTKDPTGPPAPQLHRPAAADAWRFLRLGICKGRARTQGARRRPTLGERHLSNADQMLNAAVAGLGLAYIPEALARPYLTKGRLKRVLEDWCPSFSGFHLYYPSRRQATPAFALLVDALRYRA